MIDLFDLDNEAELIDKQDTLKKYFHDRYKESISYDKNLQNKINSYQSYSIYQAFRSAEKEQERVRVNELY